MIVETLESRRLMSGGVGSSISAGKLTISGGADASQIVVVEHNGDVWVNSPNPNISDPGTANFHGVTGIAINAQAKADTIYYTGDTIGAVISSGGGNDSIFIDDTGTGSSYVNGGGGDDSITVIHSHNTTVVGGGGHDQFYLNTANDQPAGGVYAGGGGGKNIFISYGGTVITDASKQDTVIDLS